MANFLIFSPLRIPLFSSINIYSFHCINKKQNNSCFHCKLLRIHFSKALSESKEPLLIFLGAWHLFFTFCNLLSGLFGNHDHNIVLTFHIHITKLPHYNHFIVVWFPDWTGLRQEMWRNTARGDDLDVIPQTYRITSFVLRSKDVLIGQEVYLLSTARGIATFWSYRIGIFSLFWRCKFNL